VFWQRDANVSEEYYASIFKPDGGDGMLLRKSDTFTRLKHGVVTQNIVI
jgi:hypothetical protein